MRICMNTQTPPVRFKLSYTELLEKYGELDDPLDVKGLERGVDYEYSPGGVTAMMLPLLNRMSKLGYADDPIWISLGVNYPPSVIVDGIAVSHVELDEEHLRAYASFKEYLWSLIHGLSERPIRKEEYLGYVRYNWVNAEKLLQYLGDVDVFYIQDFQLLQTGQMIGVSAPAVLRWHVPFRPENLRHLGKFVLRAMEGFDSVVVSTRRDLEGLISSSYHGHAHQIYPFIDEDQWSPASRASTAALREKVGLKADEKLLLVVARMDPIKSQDLAIRALARIKKRTKVRLLMIGNGSFSSSQSGGLGHDKGAVWREHLRQEAKSLGVEDRVVFLGYASADELRSAYGLASALLLPSKIEGFGITVLESWTNKRPVVVSKGAGASELVVNGSNGYTFAPGDDSGLAEGVLKAIGPKMEQMGENGFETAKQCFVGEAAKKVKSVLEEASTGY
jgi:glycosyltransferase involved in cell wall biosynthesis